VVLLGHADLDGLSKTSHPDPPRDAVTLALEQSAEVAARDVVRRGDGRRVETRVREHVEHGVTSQ
jgi:hypothetical protein